MTDEEWERLKELAQGSGVSVSQYIRYKSLKRGI
jgi:hypothetical protein